MRIYIILILSFVLSVLSNKISGQQMPQYSQYMLNDYVINPAIAGTKNYYIARSNNRYQWTGIVDAPRTYVLSVYGPHKTLDMGFGGYIFNDVTGPTSRTGLYGSYSYILQVQPGMKLSMGLSAGLLQYRIDGTKINFHENDEPVLNDNILSDYLPDASLGFYLFTSDYYAGFSVGQLFSNKLKFNDVEALGINKLKSHFFLTGGYKYILNTDFTVEPSAIIKFMTPVPIQFELNGKLTYQNKTWIGLSFRTKDALAFIIGYNYEDQIYFGYSYDVTVSSLRKYSSGTHELMIGIRFNNIKEPIELDEFNEIE